ncbi:unnamed protein product [Ceutorhynchus assimilis]|uniref:Inner centromere protein ARK-binding domain-containing protein n=1 Tax=Ceutorhynchus assimilis TaxID=467358 RepID=A0A9N9MLK2_9CUCU|nr:unnamed protein product [Ceutorhynchus assimilis]
MTNRALEAFLELSDDTDFPSKAKEIDESFESLLRDDVLPFIKAAKNFIEKGIGDYAALGIEDEVAALNLNAKKKGGAVKKKNEVLKETTTENVDNVQVKKEKLSILDKENCTITKMEMPAPNWIPPKKKVKEIKTERSTMTRTTRSKVGKGNASERESDVIIQNPELSIIDLSDNENSQTVQTRSGRTKKRDQTQDNMDAATTKSARSKTRNQKAENVNETVEMETRSTRTKTLRKAKKDEEVPNEEPEIEPRSTRTKTVRKRKDASEDEAKNSDSDDNKMSTRNAKGKTVKKAKDTSEDEAKNNIAEESQRSTRSARTKTIKKTNKVDASEEESDIESTRSTRTKTIRKQTDTEHTADIPKPGNKSAVSKLKRSRSGEDDEDDSEEKIKSRKKSKSNSPPPVNITTQSEYEDAQTSPDKGNVCEKPLNSTYIAPNPGLKPVPPLKQIETARPPTAANATIVVSEPSYNIFKNKSDNNLFTDDESLELNKSPKKEAPMSAKEVFSPYAKSSTKKKVEAFEKLQKVNEVPVKLSGIPRSARDTPIKDKLKLNNTPLSKFMPTSCSTSKVSRLLSSQQLSRTSSNDSLLSRTASAQKDPRERQRKNLEREQALKKKEAMLLAQAEAKRKQNEEKQLKALQQRKLIEVEKQKQLELQKQKEDRHKQRELEREEYNQKNKLELEKKRAAQKKKIQELQEQRKAEQEAKELQDQHHRKREPPVYMINPAPPLPSYACYDSDDADHPYPANVIVPPWSKSRALNMSGLNTLAAGEKIKNTLFCIHAQTPDLAEVFQNIDRRKLQRNSSRLWKRAPRYTMMPDLNETKFSEDELDNDDDEGFNDY